MKWFKHISDSLTDPFIAELIAEFGPLGYVVFFGTLEFYAREFKISWEKPEDFRVIFELFWRNFGQKSQKNTKKILKYIAKNKDWQVNFDGPYLELHIPKFTQLLDESTRKRLKLAEQKNSGNDPETIRNETIKVTPTDLDLDLEESLRKDSRQVPARCPHSKIVESYHRHCPMLPKVRDWHEGRQKYTRARWGDDVERQNLAWWDAYFLRVAASDFLTGKVPGRNGKDPFRADLVWLTNKDNMTKVLEGKYDNQEQQSLYGKRIT